MEKAANNQLTNDDLIRFALEEQSPKRSEMAGEREKSKAEIKASPSHHTASLNIIRDLSAPKYESTSPLLYLQQQVRTMFTHGPERAKCAFVLLIDANSGVRTTSTSLSTRILALRWDSSAAAASLVMLLAWPQERMSPLLDRQLAWPSAGQPTLREVREGQRHFFLPAYREAKAAAKGPEAKSTLLEVFLVDVHSLRLQKDGAESSKPCTSFSHTFVVAFGPEGMIVWQGCGGEGWGYGLDTYISPEHNGARIRSWEDAGAFADRVEKLTEHKGKWDKKCNNFYKHCFGVDLRQICSVEGVVPALTPKYEAWLKILVFEDLTVEQLRKFSY
ncbi:hypothetical protein LTR62_005233 [Meristemomyces frigidus]|uniref:Uncharacterized protein n=1 Tax=Meristemomyces frigidus TaxID=1508187 RepID=A0AAN7TH20_9PEZI|nr:hypothetical protein LTR62_005233 [Meristemomyces frigidus]